MFSFVKRRQFFLSVYPSLQDMYRIEDQIHNEVASMKTTNTNYSFSSVQFSCSVVSNCLRPHEPQHARPPCPSSTPGVHPNPCPSSQWCHPTISSSVVPFSSFLQSFPASGSFPESALRIRWPKYWSFSFNISPTNEHLGLISFRTDWLDLLAVQGTLKSLLQHHSSKASASLFTFPRWRKHTCTELNCPLLIS